MKNVLLYTKGVLIQTFEQSWKILKVPKNKIGPYKDYEYCFNYYYFIFLIYITLYFITFGASFSTQSTKDALPHNFSTFTILLLEVKPLNFS